MLRYGPGLPTLLSCLPFPIHLPSLARVPLSLGSRLLPFPALPRFTAHTFVLTAENGRVAQTAIVWDVASGKALQQLKEHRHFVQGVTWSPRGNEIATQSSDRTCKLYTLKKKKKTAAFAYSSTLAKLSSPAEPATPEKKGAAASNPAARPRVQRLFVDETKTTFFRRLSYSPDGRLLITPAGRYQDEAGAEQNTLYVFRTSMPSAPACRIKVDDQHTVVAVRCCPVVFEMRHQGEGCRCALCLALAPAWVVARVIGAFTPTKAVRRGRLFVTRRGPFGASAADHRARDPVTCGGI